MGLSTVPVTYKLLFVKTQILHYYFSDVMLLIYHTLSFITQNFGDTI